MILTTIQFIHCTAESWESSVRFIRLNLESSGAQSKVLSGPDSLHTLVILTTYQFIHCTAESWESSVRFIRLNRESSGAQSKVLSGPDSLHTLVI